MNKPHPQAEFIIAKANGATIQYKGALTGIWHLMPEDDWDFTTSVKYRIKPEPVYPVTRMTGEELRDIYMRDKGSPQESHIVVANAVIRRAIQDGDVVLPGEKE